MRISNIYITPTDEWLVTEVPSSINLNYEKKLIRISIIKAKGKAALEPFIKYMSSKNIIFSKIKCKVGNKNLDGIQSEDRHNNVIYNNLTIAFDKDTLISVSYSREDNDANAKIVESFLSNNIKIVTNLDEEKL